MIVHTSALIAILRREPEAAQYLQLIQKAHRIRLSAATFVELFIVIERLADPDAARQCEILLQRAGITIEPLTLDQAHIARQAFHDFGKGRHPAGLNFGDCFAYALARFTGEPLLFKGDDFRQTDITPAL